MAGRGKRVGDVAAVESDAKRTMDPAQAARLLPMLAALLVAFGLWGVVAGGLRMRDDARESALELARENAVAAVTRSLGDQRQLLGKRLQSSEFKDAIARGDTPAAVAAAAAATAAAQLAGNPPRRPRA